MMVGAGLVLPEPSALAGRVPCVEAALGEHSPRIEIDGKAVETCTRITASGGYVLTLSTVLPHRGIELHSTYTGHPQAERALVSELFLCKSREPLSYTREADPRELPVLHERGNCLYDHLMRLHDLLTSLGFGDVTIHDLDGALGALRP
jgi:hypothetical protein